MAEAAVDSPTSAQLLKYFCHQCSDSVEIKAATDATKLTCPKCDSSFIEEMTQELENDHHLQSDNTYDRDPMSFLGTSNTSRFLSSMLFNLGSVSHEEEDDIDSDDDDEEGLYQFLGEQPPLSSSSQSGGSGSASDRNSSQQSPFHRFLEQLLGNLRASNASQSAEFLPGLPPILQSFHGDPRDYAWGADGLDNIITELLNQTEGTGPPPAAKEDIDTLPSTTITQDHIDQASQCSVCLENFQLDETAKCLPCEHIFHSDCVIPWLQLHRTCPICRKAVGGDAVANSDVVTPFSRTATENEAGPANLRLSRASSNNSSIFEDAFEESGRSQGQEEANSRSENCMESDLFDDTSSNMDFDN